MIYFPESRCGSVRSLRSDGGFHLFGIEVQRVVELAQQAAHRGRTDRATSKKGTSLEVHFCWLAYLGGMRSLATTWRSACADCCGPTSAPSWGRRPFPGQPTPRGPRDPRDREPHLPISIQ